MPEVTGLQQMIERMMQDRAVLDRSQLISGIKAGEHSYSLSRGNQSALETILEELLDQDNPKVKFNFRPSLPLNLPPSLSKFANQRGGGYFQSQTPEISAFGAKSTTQKEMRANEIAMKYMADRKMKVGPNYAKALGGSGDDLVKELIKSGNTPQKASAYAHMPAMAKKFGILPLLLLSLAPLLMGTDSE